jgi:nicotinate dehydrogenase subunit A
VTELQLNGRRVQVEAEADTPLLYVLRDDLGLNGAKYGCGLGQCGACTVLVDGKATFSCLTPIGTVGTKAVTTIEGLGPGGMLGPLQQAFEDEQAAQCGYCIAGMVMRAEGLLRANHNPTEAQIRAGMQTNLCRCGCSMRILKAVRQAADHMAAGAKA